MPKYFTMNSNYYMKYTLRELFENAPEGVRENPNFIEDMKRLASKRFRIDKFPGIHVQAIPLVQVFAVSIYRYNKPVLPDESYKVFGTIQATNVGGYEDVVDLYNRDDENPETVTSGGFLSLYGPGSNDRPILQSYDTKLKVHLKGFSQGKDVVIAQGEIDISLESQDVSELGKVELVQGKHGFAAAVLYATFYSAVMAKVDVQVLLKGKQEGSQTGHHLCGSIIAQCHNKYEYLNDIVAKNGQVNCLSRVLFEMGRNQPEHVEQGTHIRLCDSMVAVPAYSSLVIELDLMNSDTERKIVQERVEISPIDNEQGFQKNLEGHDCVVKVLVKWRHLDKLLLAERLQHDISEDSDEEEESLTKVVSKPNERRLLIPRQRLEVFSIFIGHKSYKDLSLYGRIVVFDGFRNHSIFKRDKNRPQPLSPSNRGISIVGSLVAFEGTEVHMDIDLKDKNGGLAIKGAFGFNDVVLDDRWCDNRICSVIQGKGGYAAIHYSVFSDAVQAKVRVSITSKESSLVYPEVYGTLVAQYANWDYSSSYESKYYRVTLYDKLPGNNGPQLYGRGRLPLSKPAIAVPLDSSLIIDVDLYLDSSKGTNQDAEHIRASKEFKFVGPEETCESILGQCFSVDLTIIWSPIDD